MANRGPKLTQIDWEHVKKLCGLFCTGEEIAGFIECDYDTINTACSRELKVKFSDYIKTHQAKGKVSLRRSQFINATQNMNPTMQVWLGKNVLGQTDKLPEDQTNEVDALIKAFAALSGKLPV